VIIGGRYDSAWFYWKTPDQNLGHLVWEKCYISWLSLENASLLWGLSHACWWLIVAYILFRKKIFFKV